MDKILGAVGGILLITIAFMMFVLAMPNLAEVTNSNTGHTFENQSSFFKTTATAEQNAILIFPIMFFFGGLALLYKTFF